MPEATDGHHDIASEEVMKRMKALADAVADKIASGSAEPTIWSYDARFPLESGNLYQPEYLDTAAKRWVGPEPALQLKASLRGEVDYRMAVTLMDFISAEAEADFGVAVNGTAVPVQRIGRGVYRANFRTTHGGTQLIRLFTSRAVSPSEIEGGGEDVRKLAFSLSNILITKSS